MDDGADVGDGGSILPDEGQECQEGERQEVYTLPLTAFNVDALSHPLTHFKPVLCVENGFVTGSDGDLSKATHIVIQQRPQKEGSVDKDGAWAEALGSPSIPIRCKNTSGELHKDRFGSGGRGRCILRGKSWYTPIEFEAACGRGSSKDWKRSLRYGGHSIQTLIDERVLHPHATSCTCATCCDDASAAGPVRYFVPYKRRRRTAREPGAPRDSGGDESDADAKKEEAWQRLTDGLDAQDDGPPPPIHPPPPSGLSKRLDDLTSRAARHFAEFKTCMEEMKAIAAEVRKTADAPARDPDGPSKRCANCDREASAECSLCRRTSYCSTFCQKKDWASHQIECMRANHSDHQGQSIMLIVENAPQ